MAGKSQNAVSGKEKKRKKEKTIQQQKGLPTLSADLKKGKYFIVYLLCFDSMISRDHGKSVKMQRRSITHSVHNILIAFLF